MTFSRSPKDKTITAPRRLAAFAAAVFIFLNNFLYAVPLYAAEITSAFEAKYALKRNAAAPLTDVPADAPVTQNFDGIGTAAAAALPADFRVDKLTTVRSVGSYSATTAATNFAGGTNLSTAATNGIYNFGSTVNSADRAVGFLSSGTATQSGNLYAKLTNNTAGSFDALEISYDVEKYRSGSNPAGFRIQLYYSVDGSTWTAAGVNFLSSFGADANNNGFATAPGTTTSISNKTLAANIPASGTFYLAWNYSVAANSTTTNAQALAIDNISIKGITSTTATPTPTPTATPTATPTPTATNPTGTGTANPSSVLPGASTLLTVNVTPGANPASSGIAVSADLSSIGGSSTQQFFSGSAFTFQAAIPVGTAPGVKTLPFTVSDAEGRTSGSNSISLTVEQPPVPPDHVVISQIYGGGGNSGATFKNDYVELYNPTGTTINLLDFSLQYAASTGSGWDGSKQTLYGSIAPGEYLLVSLASGGSTGLELPLPNISSAINISGTAGKIALVGNAESLSGNCPLNDPDLVDFVGYGTTADCWEGPTTPASRAVAPSNTTSLYRNGGGAADTNNNKNDFFTSSPSPRRTASIVAPPEVGPRIESADPVPNNANAPRDASITITLNEPIFVDPAWFSINCAATGQHADATVASGNNAKSFVITPYTNFQAGEQCSVMINKDAVHDQDTDDAVLNTDTLAADYSWTFTVSTGTTPPYGSDVHLTMGNPSNATSSLTEPNNYLMEKPEFALSYNRERGTPNWVSWHLEDTWVGSLTRVDTFRPDPAVPSDWYRVQATDYLASGFDRGHMTPNADRDKETSAPINQATFLMTNMLPQAPDNNQGPWAAMENDLRALLGSNEIYIVSGGAGTGGIGSNNGSVVNTLAGGKIAVPAFTWKVALVIPEGDDDVARVSASARTIAVIMPNVQGIRNNTWQNYLTSIDQVEALTGYDFYANLPDAVENSIEAGINGANPPGAADQTVTVNEDTPQPITLTAVNPNNNPLNFTIVSQPAHGTFSGSAPNLTYTPASNYNGPDSFTFRANSGTQTSNLATVTITVNPVNDVPVANGGSISTDEDTPSSAFTLTGSDADNDALTFEIVTAPVKGTYNAATGVYTPNANANGNDSFTLIAKDAASQSSAATVSISINPVNDAPTAASQSFTTDEDTAKTITLSGSDVDGDALTYTASQPSHGSVSCTGASCIYTPTANYNGADSFTFVARDATSQSLPATVNVTVNPVNDSPVFVSIAPLSQTVDYSDAVQAIAVTVSDVDNFPGSLVVTAVAPLPSGLTLSQTAGTGSWTISGNANVAAGIYTINLKVTDTPGASTTTSAAAGNQIMITVIKEKTATDYTGDFDLMTAGPAINTATVRLGAKLTQESDGSAGDITKATATFKIFKSNAATASYTVANVPVNANGEALTTYTLPADTYSISVEVDGNNGYWTANPINPGLLNITVPTDEQRSSGGGWVADAASASGKANLAFSVSSSRNGQPKGNVSFSFKGTDGFNYLVKGNSWQGGYLQFSAEPGVTPTVYSGSNIKGNCNVQKIDPTTGSVVASFGNYTFEIFTRDGDLLNPRQGDSYSITVRDSSNAVFHQVGSQNSPVILGGGNITNKAR